MIYDETEHFRGFISEMNNILMSNSEKDGRNQKDLMNELFAAEESFKKTLIRTKGGPQMFKAFVYFITQEAGNILKARSYFRERQAVFSEEISVAFYTGKHTILYNYSINYTFMRWVMKRYKDENNRVKLQKKFDEVSKLRHLLCENNLPLALHKTKLFWSKVPYTRMTYMDMVQATNEGLLTAIDKFAPPYKTNFRHVAIGRMTLNLLTDHNSTLLHMSPKDKRILYRSNKGKSLGLKGEELVEYVTEKFNNVDQTYIDSLFSSSATAVDLHQPLGDGDDSTLLDITPDVATTEIEVEKREKINNLYNNIDKLSIIERKIIRMKFGI